MEYRNKKILVLGKGITGKAITSFLEKKEAFVTLADEKENGSFLSLNPLDYDLIVHSPGISRQHPFLLECDRLKVKITNEIEIASQFTDKKIIGVTGTNGKTTTVNLIHHLLNACQVKNALVGNVGKPFIDYVEEGYDYYSLELSSYQLETIENFKPDIAIITNMTPDHLERHKTMENYLQIKGNIYKNMAMEDALILNYDDAFLKELAITNTRVYYVSSQEEVKGIYLKDDRIYLNVDEKRELLDIKDLLIFGLHNMENIMFSILAGYLSGLNLNCLLVGAKSFKGVEHRLEFVREVKGVKIFNDSKSTNPEASITAIKAFDDKKMYLILGGSPKEVSYIKLAETIKEYRVFPIVQGETKEEIRQALEEAEVKEYQLEDNMKAAFDFALLKALEGEIIILSPGCASFDQFVNFEERGEVFKKYVRSII